MSRRSAARSTARLTPRKTARLAVTLTVAASAAALCGCALLVVLLMPGSSDPDASRKWAFGLLMTAVVTAAVAATVYVQAGKLSLRLKELGLSVAKIGRSSSEVKLRGGGEDEIGELTRTIQLLANDVRAMVEASEKGGGQAASRDPQSRAYRDATLDAPFARPAGYEVDAAIGAGSRGGLDYFGCVEQAGECAVYAVSGEGQGPMTVVAARFARDALVRAFEAGLAPQAALEQVNATMHRELPRGVCAKASVLKLNERSVDLYQAGDRAPLWIGSAGEILELNADGLALGLDAGPVFAQTLRPETIEMSAGVRLVLTNDAGSRSQELLDLVQEHSPKHTAPFMNLVLAGVEAAADAEGLREDLLLLTVKKS